MTRDTDHTEPHWTRRGVIGAIAAAATATLPVPTAAEDGETEDTGLFADPTLTESIVWSGAYLDGVRTAVQQGITQRVFGAEETAVEDAVDSAVAEFGDHTGDWLTYVNDRDLGGTDHQSLSLTFSLDGNETTRYILANYDADAGEYVELSVVEEYDTESDHSARLEGDAVRNAADELKTLHEEYIVPNEDVDESYISGLAGRYRWLGDHITASIL